MQLPLFITALLLCATGESFAQGVSIGFHNDTKHGILIQGGTMVNNMPKYGQPFLVTPGKTGFDNNVPQGIRFISICDSAKPKIVLLQVQIPVQNRDLVFSVRLAPNGQLTLVPKK